MASQASSMYDYSIVPFIGSMKNLLHCMDKAEQYAKEKGENVEDYVNLQIHPDMKNFLYQIQRVSDTAKFAFTRIASPSLDESVLSMADTESTWSDLRSRLNRTIALLEEHAKADAFVGQEDKEIVLYGGKYKFTGKSYLQTFAIPNFYFHVTTAYCLLRARGVPVGKMDYVAGSKVLSG